MILVTVGTGYQTFTRMLQAMDDVAGQINEWVLMQVGHTPLVPKHAEWFNFVPYEKMHQYLREASVIVCHASTGPLSSARYFNKPVVVMPRDPQLGEARDAHQLETACRIKDSSQMIEIINDTEDLLEAVRRAMEKSFQGMTYEVDSEFSALIENLRAYVSEIEKRLQ
jgi:UDP-N-acetylglucosamine transferase subunit ALG13